MEDADGARAPRAGEPGLGARVLRALEVPVLVAVPVALVACAALGAVGSAGLSLGVALVAVALLMAGFEASRPELRQLMPTVVLGAVAAAGRVLFAALPEVKPVSAVAIVAGACLGRRSGFMVGALAALVSNMFFGQGPWTPWQMYAWGLVGYVAGVLADHGLLASRRAACALGLASGPLYGLILNAWHVVGYVSPVTPAAVAAAFAAGLPLDVVHGLATAAFLALAWDPWRTRILRVVRAHELR